MTTHRAFRRPRSLLLLAAAAMCLSVAQPALPATITVTGTGDAVLVDGSVTLREAIASINGGANINADVVAVGAYGTADTINFAIGGGGLHTIALVGVPLDTTTKPLIINGFSQPGSAPNTNATGALNATYTIQIDASGASGGTGGVFNVSGGSSTIRGLVINGGSSSSGIRIVSSGNHVEGNYIGTNATGTSAIPNGSHGVLIADGTGNVVGGTTPDTRNLISGNSGDGVDISGPASGHTVQGNLIGINAAGTAAIANTLNGVSIENSPNNTVGGTAAGAGNVISGNGDFGLAVFDAATAGTTIQGNRIGTNVAGTASIANALGGVDLRGGAHDNTIGGTTAAARNLISGNDLFGVQLLDTGVNGNIIQGNFIGTDVAGAASLPNSGFGILVAFGNTNTIGGSARRSGEHDRLQHRHRGRDRRRRDHFGNPVLGNSIFSNSDLGIDLGGDGVTGNDACDADTGSNGLQNFPVITSVLASVGSTEIIGTLNSTASTGPYRVEFFSSPTCDPSGFGEGKTFLGIATPSTDPTCASSFDVTLPVTVSAGSFITATATDPSNNTSEFSQCFAVVGGPTATNTPTITPTFTVTSTPTNTPAGVPTNTPTVTPTNTTTATPTNTPTGTLTPTSTPTSTPTFTPVPGGFTPTPVVAGVPMLSPSMFVLLGLALGAAALLLMKRR